MHQYEKCIPIFESIVSSNEYENDIFCSSLQILFDCYTNENEYSKLVKKYEELSPQNISCYWNVSFAAGNAFEKLGQKKDAFACYEKIALNAELPLSAQALQKACYVSTEDFSLLLEKAKSALSCENSLLSEFWIRLGIDSFEKNDFGVDAIHVLDPTMLLTKEDYVHLIEAENESPSEGTLFNYILDPDANKTSFIKKVATETGLKVFQVLPKCQAETRSKRDVKSRIEDCVFPGD